MEQAAKDRRIVWLCAVASGVIFLIGVGTVAAAFVIGTGEPDFAKIAGGCFALLSVFPFKEIFPRQARITVFRHLIVGLRNPSDDEEKKATRERAWAILTELAKPR